MKNLGFVSKMLECNVYKELFFILPKNLVDDGVRRFIFYYCKCGFIFMCICVCVCVSVCVFMCLCVWVFMCVCVNVRDRSAFAFGDFDARRRSFKLYGTRVSVRLPVSLFLCPFLFLFVSYVSKNLKIQYYQSCIARTIVAQEINALTLVFNTSLQNFAKTVFVVVIWKKSERKNVEVFRSDVNVLN